MANFFDKFDDAATASGNPFDQFDEPTKPTEGGFAPREAREREISRDERRSAYREMARGVRERQSTFGRYADTAVRGAARAVPFMDELASGVLNPFKSTEDYQEELDRQRAMSQVDDEDRMFTSIGGQLAGSLALPGAGWASTGGALSRVAKGAALGTGYGALYGAGSGDTMGERAQGAYEGAKMGLGFGLVGGAGLEAARAGAGALNALARPLIGYARPNDEALRRVGAALGQDRAVGAGRLMDDAAYAAAERAGQDPMLIDRGGGTIRALARDARNTSPEAAQVLESALAERAATQNEAAGSFLSGLFSPLRSPNPEATIERLQRRAQAANRANYARAEQEAENLISPRGQINPQFPDGLMTPVLDRLAQSPLVQEAMKRSVGTGANEAAMRGYRNMPPRNPFVETAQGYVLRPAGPNGDRVLPTLPFWDQVQRNLRSVYQEAQRSGNDNVARQAAALRQQLNSHLDEILPAFRDARQGAARFFGAEDALEAGQNFFAMTKRQDVAQARQALARMSPPERALFAEGYLAAAENAARSAGDGRSASRLRLWNSPAEREKLELALGPRRAAEANAYRARAQIMEWMNNAVRGNSSTAQQLAMAGLAGGAAGSIMTGDVSGGLSGAGALMLARYGAKGIKGAVDERVAREVARILTSNDPAVYQQVLQRSQRPQAISEALNRIEAHVGKAMGVIGDEVADRQREPNEITVTPRGYAEGGLATEPKTGDQYYGPGEEDRQLLESLSPGGERYVAAPRTEYPGDELQARYADKMPLGVMVPRNAVDLIDTDSGAYPVDAEGRRLDWVRRPGMIPIAKDETGYYAAMPVLPDIMGNVAGGGTEGAGMMVASGFRLPGKAGKGAKSAVTAGDAAVDAEHAMNIEKGERFTINASSVRLTDAEKAIVNALPTPAQQAKAATAIREKKANYPVSDGWLPMEAKAVTFNDKGEPEVAWQAAPYGFNRGKFDVERPVLDEAGNKVRQPKLDAEGNPLLDEEGNPVLTNRIQKETVKEELAPRRGSPEYDRLVNKATRNSLKEIEDIIARAQNGDEAARVILRQAGWYRETMRKGFDERGGAYPSFADLLGGTSPNTAVDQNYAYSVDLQKRFSRGDFDEPVAFTRDYQGSLTEFPEDQLLRRNDAFDESGVGKQYGINSRNAAMALADRWRELVPGQAPKARNFSGNLGGQTDKATIDLWAARFLNRMTGRKRVPPPLESGVGGALGQDLRAGGEFGFGQDVFQKLSDELNRKGNLLPFLQDLGYTNVTPMDLQALTWFMEKEHWGRNRWTTKTGEGGSFEDEMRKYPTQRWQSGFSIQQAEPPTDEAMNVARQAVEAPLKQDDNVRVFRVIPTYGRYAGTNERSFDVELSAKPGWDPRQWMASVIDQAKANNQYDVFFSRRLGDAELSNPNARPGVEIYFKSRQEMDKILPLLEEFTKRGADGFTFVTDLKLRERLAGGSDVPDYVGVRLQFVPEITARWDDAAREAWVKDPKALQSAMSDAAERMQQAVNAISQNADVVDARLHFYDTLAVGRESYDNFLAGIADPDGAAGVFEGPARSVDPLKRFGQPVHSHVEGRNRALGAGAEAGLQDDGGAVSGVVGGNPLTKAKGGWVKKRGGPSGRPVDSSPSELHQYLLATSNLAPPQRYAMGGAVFPAAVEPRMNALNRGRRGALSTPRP